MELNFYQLLCYLCFKFFDLVMFDMNFKIGDIIGNEGMCWLEKVWEFLLDMGVIMMMVYVDVKMVVEVVKVGVMDFLEKFWCNECLFIIIKVVLEFN